MSVSDFVLLAAFDGVLLTFDEISSYRVEEGDDGGGGIQCQAFVASSERGLLLLYP